jgi:protein-disulfide isomerase
MSTPPRRTNRLLIIVLGAVLAAAALAAVLVALSQGGGDDGSGDLPAAVVAPAPPAASEGSAPPPPSSTTQISGDLKGVADVERLLDGIPSEGDTLGRADAPVTILAYEDLRCPVCREHATEVMPGIIMRLVRTGRVKLRFRLWPILGEDSDRAAAGGYAALKQDALWRFAELWFHNQGDEGDDYSTDPYQRAIAQGAGLDLARFDTDRADRAAVTRQIDEVNDEALRLGFTGTPGFVVTNGLRAEPLAGFAEGAALERLVTALTPPGG